MKYGELSELHDINYRLIILTYLISVGTPSIAMPMFCNYINKYTKAKALNLWQVPSNELDTNEQTSSCLMTSKILYKVKFSLENDTFFHVSCK